MPTFTGAHPDGIKATQMLQNRGKTLQILEMQQVLKDDVLNKKLKPLERASCARSWDLLEERLRIRAGKPLPGHLQPEERRKVSKRLDPDHAAPSAIQDVPKVA